jgi:hypothetical protein
MSTDSCRILPNLADIIWENRIYLLAYHAHHMPYFVTYPKISLASWKKQSLGYQKWIDQDAICVGPNSCKNRTSIKV